MKRRGMWAAAVAAVMVVGSSAPAEAGMAIRMTLDGTVVTVQDNAAGDTDGRVGVMNVSSSTANWIIAINIGVSKPIVGRADFPKMDLAVVAMSLGAGSATFELTDTDFMNTNPSHQSFKDQIGGTSSVGNNTFSLQALSYYDEGNAEFAQTSLLTDIGPITTTPFAEQDSVGNPITPQATYSLTLVKHLVHDSGGLTTFDNELCAVPEPGTIAVWSLLGGLGLVAGWRRRRRASK